MRNYTIEYYNKNATEYSKQTQNVDVSMLRTEFLSYLKPHAKILDVGCGSGRDTKFFADNGFIVHAIDGSSKLSKIATMYSGIEVECIPFQEYHAEDLYDGIWACASLLHLNKVELETMMEELTNSLTNCGVMYLSFKYGEEEKKEKGRFYNNMSEKKLSRLIKEFEELSIKRVWISSDVSGRMEKWLNAIIEKRCNNQNCVQK